MNSPVSSVKTLAFVVFLAAAAFFSSSPTLWAHSLYTSFTHITWNAQDKSVEVAVQSHAHEMESRLSLELGERLTFLNDADYVRLNSAMEAFIMPHISVSVDGKSLPLDYVGMEMDGQVIYIYLESPYSVAPSRVTAMNSLFLDDLPGQVNNIMVDVNKKRKAGDVREGSGPVHFVFP